MIDHHSTSLFQWTGVCGVGRDGFDRLAGKDQILCKRLVFEGGLVS